MKISVLCNDGSPLFITMKSIYGEDGRAGVGGAELALLTLCEEWHKAGHNVCLYNNPLTLNGSPFEQRNINTFNPNEDRDILIIFRSPNSRSLAAKGLKVWFSCDQATIGNFKEFAGTVHKIVCISPRHAQFFEEYYGIRNTIVIDIPVRMDDFDRLGKVMKIKNRLIFTSVPARGLDNLWRIYPFIQDAIPDVSLAITSDYRLWGFSEGNAQFRLRWLNRSNVEFFGALPRVQYIEELMKSQILLYSSNYDELFCVAVSEAQYAGVYPITSATGALPTTNMGTVLDLDANNFSNDRAFANETIELLSNPKELDILQKMVYKEALERFNPEVILAEWDRKVFS